METPNPNLENCEVLYEIKEKSTSVTIKEFTDDGAKLQYNSHGEMKGKYSGIHMETVDVTQRVDGTNDWQVRAIETTHDGDMLIISGAGTGRMIGNNKGNMQGEVTFMTMSPRLASLNNTRGWIEGNLDFKKGESDIKVYSLTPPVQAAAAPTAT
jgi:hypothetical protein